MSTVIKETGDLGRFKSMATLLAFGAAMAIGIATTVATSSYYIGKIRIGSQAYGDIVQTKDLVADILPPPLYVIEPYLEANRLYNKSESIDEAKTSIAKLKKDYDQRRDYWKSSNLDPAIKSKMTEESHAFVVKFWNLLESGLLPAVEANDEAAARDSFTKLTAEYQAHRAVIDEIVKLANALGEKVEAASKDQGTTAIWAIGAVDIALFVLLIAGLTSITRRLIKPLRILGNGLEHLSKGDMTLRLTQKFPPEYRQLQENYNGAVDKLSDIVNSVRSSASEVTSAAAEISSATTDLSQRTEEQAASLEETSAAMEEMAATVRRNAENAHLANQDAAATRDVADRGGKVVAKAVEAMAKIEDSSRKVSDIIGVIDEIARQTNLLALNAAVEAARAGDAGRGFAVVASEVRSLAQRSSQAAKDIKELITSSNGQVKDGVDLVNKAGESLTDIVGSINKVASVVSEIANASAEQATGIDQINKALTQMDEVTQQNSALVEENAATTKTLEHQASTLDEQVACFRTAPAGAAVAVAAPKATATVTPLKKAAKAAVAVSPARDMQTSLKTAVGQDWQEF